MKKISLLFPLVIGLITVPVVSAQGVVERDLVPLKNWDAPMYWQPSTVESKDAAAKQLLAANAGGDRASSITPQAQTPANSLVFVGMTPCRITDTRNATFPAGFGPPNLTGGIKRTFDIQSLSSPCPVPSIAQAYSFNITVVPPGFLDFITVWPTGQAQPNASTLNSYIGTVIANAAIVPAGTSGSVDVYASQNTHLIIDINGYYAQQSGITLAQGTAGAPPLSFAGDPGTGIFSTGTGALNISTGGTNRLTVRSDGDVELTGNIRKGGSLFLHNVGDLNTGVGFGALSSNTGNANTATGSLALFSNTTACCNTATGDQALHFNTGLLNTAVGHGALFNNTTGNNNTAIGSVAGASDGKNISGSNNTFIGFAAAPETTQTLNNATAIGAHAVVSASNALVLGDGSVNVGIGVTAPAAKLDVAESNAHFLVGSGGCGGGPYMAIGFGAHLSNCSNYSMLGDGTNTYINRPTGGSIVFRENNISNPSNQMTITPGGNVGIGTHIPSALLTVNGTAAKPFGGFWDVFSDARLKTVHGDFQAGLKEVLQLRPVRYQYKPQNAMGITDHEEHIGLVAQEVEKVIPEAVNQNDQGYLLVKNDPILWAMLNSIKEQQAQIEGQQERIFEQEEQLAQQQRQIDRLKELICLDRPLAAVCK